MVYGRIICSRREVKINPKIIGSRRVKINPKIICEREVKINSGIICDRRVKINHIPHNCLNRMTSDNAIIGHMTSDNGRTFVLISRQKKPELGGLAPTFDLTDYFTGIGNPLT